MNHIPLAKMIGFIFLFLYILSDVTLSQQALQNIGYLGTGYNLIEGNPLPRTGLDLGYKSPIVVVNEAGRDGTTPDGRFWLPRGVSAREVSRCDDRSKSTEIFGATSYGNLLQNSVGTTGSLRTLYADYEFSASREYQQIRRGTNEENKRYVAVSQSCAVYNAQLIPGSYRLSEHFVNEVRRLVNKRDLNPYYRFINQWGTSVVTEVQFGTKVTRTTEFSQRAWTRLRQNNVNIQAAANANFRVASLGVSSTSRSEQEMNRQFKSERTDYTQTTLGVGPPEDRSVDHWRERVFNSPYPFHITVMSIIDVLEPRYFKGTGLNAGQVNRVKNRMREALERYCGFLGKNRCSKHDPDRKWKELAAQSVMTKTNFVIGRDPGYVRCPPGHKLVSCGLSNEKKSRNFEKYPGAWPEGDGCRGFNHWGGTVHATCAPSSLTGRVQISNSGDWKRTATATCRGGYKLTGCGFQSRRRGTGKWEKYRKVTPNTGSRSCTCFNHYGVKCYAICSNNVQSSYVKEQGSGGGQKTITCNPGDIALGCTQTFNRIRAPDPRFPKFHPKGHSQCWGTSVAPFKLYAICGKFKQPRRALLAIAPP